MSTYCRYIAVDSVIFWFAFDLGNAAFSTALDVDVGLAEGITLRGDTSAISSSYERSSALTVSIVQVENTERNAKNPLKATKSNVTVKSTRRNFLSLFDFYALIEAEKFAPVARYCKNRDFSSLIFSSRLTVKLNKLTVITGGTNFFNC